jgi:folate-binding protein YgfZ
MTALPSSTPAAAASASAPARSLETSATPAAPRWQGSAADRAAFAAGPVAAEVDGLAILAVDGADAVGFLQGQTTIDVARLDAGHWQLGGYCTPKGRLLAIFEAWRQGLEVRLLLPAGIAPAIARRLGMFVLRAKVQIRDVSAGWRVLGLLGAGSGAALQAAGIDVPSAPGESRGLDGGEWVVRLPAGAACPERLLLLVQAERHAHWRQLLAALPAVGPELWWWAQIDAGVPAILGATQELFVPQAVNLEVLGGVDFRKGCYPGQEIVARSQYLGKLRRRMFLAHAAAIGDGADVFLHGSAEPVGRIVMAAAAPAGGWDLLFECPTDRTTGASLHAGSADAPALAMRALPYTLFDPTA